MAGGHVFVSYAHADSVTCRRLVEFLGGQGLQVWFDEQIPNSGRLGSGPRAPHRLVQRGCCDHVGGRAGVVLGGESSSIMPVVGIAQSFRYYWRANRSSGWE